MADFWHYLVTAEGQEQFSEVDQKFAGDKRKT